MRRYDKGGDQFYDSISALHKSVRGSDPDAALYWLVRMLDGGADPRYLARRLIRMASEDVGLADPRALRMALDAAEVYERMGSPEGELALAQCAVYLAVAPKSNAVYKAFNEVRALVKKDGTRPVPMHLRNAPTQLMKWTTARVTGMRMTKKMVLRLVSVTCPMAWARQTFTAP
jgi:putative ATPase